MLTFEISTVLNTKYMPGRNFGVLEKCLNTENTIDKTMECMGLVSVLYNSENVNT